ncbi:hypothetical protein ANCCEY_02619 [Ancylostoma ceylanicum]|uniref:Major facilitator superfamily (MFS) profile domain-containing protein n=1 Tax=Ancylostoma ceylanicum TaxID=53326 RepID=A0A0D6MC54_9BILA|nr:hypothetical protein ANCCEY_02619 [Ancylostoma ceylanicum]
MSLLRAYASTSSCIADRARAIACVSGGIATGAMIGPAFQLFFTPLGHDGIYVLPFYRLNIYNSPALFSLLLNIAGFLVMFFAFEENYDVLRADAAKTPSKLPSPCAIAIFVSVFTRFVQIFSTTTIETLVLNRRAAASSYYEMIILDFLRLGSAFSMLMFSFNNEQAVTANATAHLIAGALGVTLVPPRLSSIVCLCAYAGLFVSTYSWPFLPNKLYYPFYVLVFGFAVSVMNIAVTTLYSEIIGPRRQGTLQGVFQLAGSIGRTVAPLLTSLLYSEFGPQVPWITDILLICSTIALWILFRNKMVPLQFGSANMVRQLDGSFTD